MTSHVRPFRTSTVAAVVTGGVLTMTTMGILHVLNRVVLVPRGVNALPGSFFNVGMDLSVPTWFSSLLLLGSSAATAAAWKLARLHHTGTRGLHLHFWGVLAGTFLLLSIDEVALFHEVIGGRLGALAVGGAGFPTYVWVVAGIPFTALFAASSIPFLLSLPQPTRLRLLASGAIFVSGALGVEMINGQIDRVLGSATLTYGLMTVLEEFLEMAGAGLFLVSVLRHLETTHGVLTLRFEDDEGP